MEKIHVKMEKVEKKVKILTIVRIVKIRKMGLASPFIKFLNIKKIFTIW